MISDIEDNPGTISIHREYPIPSFNWTIELIFKQGGYSETEKGELEKVLTPLLDKEDIQKLPILLSEGSYNSALSVSDKEKHKCYLLITMVTSLGQFVNSLVHEMLHISRHIDECGNNEKLFTTLGNISGEIIKELYSL